MIQSQIILSTIKTLLKGSDISYAQLARHLDLSLVSVKRLLNGKTPLDLERLDSICNLLGINFLELCQMAVNQADLESKQLLEKQEVVLAQNEKLLVFFYLLLRGLTFSQIASKYEFTEKECLNFAIKLEKINLIELYPQNRVRILVSRYVQWREQGPLERRFRTEHQNHFLSGRFKGDLDFVHFATVLLSESAILEFKDRFARVFSDLRKASEILETKNSESIKPFTILAAGRVYVPNFIEIYRRKSLN